MDRDGQYHINSGVLSPTQIPNLQQKLDDLLPYSLPVTRRIEYHLGHPISPTARIFVAAAAVPADGDDDGDVQINGDHVHSNQPLPLPGTSSHPPDERWLESWLLSNTSSSSAASRPWLAAHIDLINYGQTQVWLFASWEVPSLFRNDSDTVTGGGGLYKSLMHELFNYIHTVLVPTMPLEPSDEWLDLKRTGKTLTTPYSRSKILFGTVGEKLWELFPPQARARTDPGYLKYVFSPAKENENVDEAKAEASLAKARLAATAADNDNDNTSLLLLPAEYKFGEMRSSDLQIVLDRSTIPRTLSTLRQYVSVAIFSRDDDTDPRPVAWGFLGKDASLSSLHTEPAHRGKGLAVCLARELLQRQTRAFQEDKRGMGWAHADVSQDNIPSRRVMEKLGGRPMWMVMWTEVDLEKVCRSSDEEDEVK
ncbi:hypothetical protein PV05_02954 [Exophiala xenobiotica]|uniref:N-acetyltransferase domain-containing protein n=1 Tax=Exophiala xenobiotica TaxID=348802 RepID=A0A0D2ERS0_9EURO|nr:uncharacterized protein PV05_02954 [Exophiala xenobiotica]KIW58433.1 hypothetical protein PV05_02954 [Exophiala xenobiotica]